MLPRRCGMSSSSPFLPTQYVNASPKEIAAVITMGLVCERSINVLDFRLYSSKNLSQT